MYRKSVTGIKIHVLNLSLYIHNQNINFKSLNKMQKMIFSVIALVAFSFAGMANEIEEKKVEVKSNKKVKFIDTDCRVERLRAYTDMRSAGISHEDASGASYGIYFACLRLKTVVSF